MTEAEPSEQRGLDARSGAIRRAIDASARRPPERRLAGGKG